MTGRPDRGGREAEPPGAEPAVEGPEGLIVVPYRPGRGSAKLLPPLLIVLLGTAFLAYRSARSADWRGVSSLFETRPAPRRPAAPLLAHRSEPLKTDPAAAPEPAPSPAPPAPEARAGGGKGQPGAVDAEKSEAKAETRAGDEKNPLDDIEREAEKTKERIAELEKLKEREARKLAESAEQRERADRDNHLGRFGLRAGRVPPEQIERMLKAQNEQLRRHMARVAEIQRRQMEQMAEMQRRFFDDADRGFARGPALIPPPGFDGFDLVPPPPLPSPPPNFNFNGNNANVNPGRNRRGPGGNGVTRFREFRTPGGLNGFVFEVRPADPEPDDAPPPPPPQPRPRWVD